MNHSPKVSILTPMFNTGREVLETIESVRASTYKDWEHIILDDASTDDSVSLIRAHIEETGYPGRLFENPANLGIAATRQALMKKARGEFLVGVADDLLRPDRIEKDVRCLESAPPRVAGVFSRVETFDHTSREVIGQIGAWKGSLDESGQIEPKELAHRLLKTNLIPAMTVTLRRSIIDSVGYDTSFFIEDYPTWVRLLKAGHTFCYRDEVSMDYRIVSTSVRSKHRSRVDLDCLRSKALFFDSGLVDNKRVRDECWRYFWSKITVFNAADRRQAREVLSKMGSEIPSALKAAFSYFPSKALQRMSHRNRTPSATEGKNFHR